VYVADSGNIALPLTQHRRVQAILGRFRRSSDGCRRGSVRSRTRPSRQFRDVTCVKVAKDGMVYVCDRMSNRIQVFQKNGQFK
jgi:hypothetical protein